MAITLTQHILGADGTTSNSASFNQAFGGAVSSGGFVVGAVYMHASNGVSGVNVTSVSDDKNSSAFYTILTSAAPTNDTSGRFLIFYGGPFTNGPTTITATVTGGSGLGQRWRIALAEFAGVQNAADGNTIAAQATPGTGTDAITSGTISPATDGDLIYSALMFNGTDPTTIAHGTNFNTADITGAPSTDAVPMAHEYLVQSAHASIAGTWTQTGAGTVTVTGVVALKAAVAFVPRHARQRNFVIPQVLRR